MRYDFQNMTIEERGHGFRVINLDTGKQLTYCQLADEETGEYERVLGPDANGNWAFGPDQRVLREKGVCRLRVDRLKEGEPYLLPEPIICEAK